MMQTRLLIEEQKMNYLFYNHLVLICLFILDLLYDIQEPLQNK